MTRRGFESRWVASSPDVLEIEACRVLRLRLRERSRASELTFSGFKGLVGCLAAELLVGILFEALLRSEPSPESSAVSVSLTSSCRETLRGDGEAMKGFGGRSLRPA